MTAPFCCHTFTKDTVLVPWNTYCHICHQTVPFFARVFKCTSCYCILHESCYANMLNILHDINEIAEKTAQKIPQRKSALVYETDHSIFKGESVNQKALNSTWPKPSEKISSILARAARDSPHGVEGGSFCEVSNLHPERDANQRNGLPKQLQKESDRISCSVLKAANTSGGEGGKGEHSPLLKTCSQSRSMTLSRVSPSLFSFSKGRPCGTRDTLLWRPCTHVCTSYFPMRSSTQLRYQQVYPLASARFAKNRKGSQEGPSWFSSSYPAQHCRRNDTFSFSTQEMTHIGSTKGVGTFFLRPAAKGANRLEEGNSAGKGLPDGQPTSFGSKEQLQTATRMTPHEKWDNNKGTEDAHDTSTEESACKNAVGLENQCNKGETNFCTSSSSPTANASVEGGKDPADAWGHSSSALQDGLTSSIKGFISGFLPSAVPFRSVSDSLTAASSRLVLASLSAASFVTSPTSFLDVQSLIRYYLDTSGKNSRNDPNVVKILESVFQLLVFFQANHPTLKSRIFNLIYLGEVGRRHQQQYELFIQDLPEPPIFSMLQSFAYGWDGVGSNKDSSKAHPARGEASDKDEDSAAFSVSGAEGLPATPMGDEKRPQTAPLTASSCEKAPLPAVYHPVIQQLQDVLRFAIAVYGAPYHTGSLSTLLGAALVFTLHKEKVARLPKAVNDQAVTDILSLPPSALKLSRWSARATEVSYALLVDHLKRRMVLSFRGTMTDADILTDICALGEPFCGGLAHQGAARTVNALFTQRASQQRAGRRTGPPPSHRDKKVHLASPDAMGGEGPIGDPPGADRGAKAAPTHGGMETSASGGTDGKQRPSAPQLEESNTSDDLLDTLERLVSAFPSYRIIITGHSLGGGVAVLFAIRLSYERFFPPEVLRRIHVISFAPMPTLTLPVAALFDEDSVFYEFPIWNIVNGCDMVPRMQVNSLHRFLGDICKGDDNTEDSAEKVEPPVDETVTEKRQSEAAYELPGGEHVNGYPTHELYHPGRVFLMTSPWDPKNNRLVEVPRGHKSMHEIFLMKPMLNTHMIDNYMEGLTNLKPLSKSSSK